MLTLQDRVWKCLSLRKTAERKIRFQRLVLYISSLALNVSFSLSFSSLPLLVSSPASKLGERKVRKEDCASLVYVISEVIQGLGKLIISGCAPCLNQQTIFFHVRFAAPQGQRDVWSAPYTACSGLQSVQKTGSPWVDFLTAQAVKHWGQHWAQRDICIYGPSKWYLLHEFSLEYFPKSVFLALLSFTAQRSLTALRYRYS